MNKKRIIRIVVISVLLCISSVILNRMRYQSSYDKQQIQSKQANQAALETIQSMLADADQPLDKNQVSLPKQGDAYASIAIERIQFQNTIFYGDSEELLNKGIGHYMGSSLPGEGSVILLAGHNGTEFYQLRNVKKDDIVKIHTNYGEYTYQIYDMKIREASDFKSNELISDEETLIMYCCYPFDELGTSQRYFVYASYVSGPRFMGDNS